MRIYLVFMIINLINNGNIKTADQIAKELEINPRSVLRYISELEIMGIPVTRLRGRNGGFVISEHFSLNFSVLTFAQRQHLLKLLLEEGSETSKQIASILNII